jgi:hypothetical protein
MKRGNYIMVVHAFDMCLIILVGIALGLWISTIKPTYNDGWVDAANQIGEYLVKNHYCPGYISSAKGKKFECYS